MGNIIISQKSIETSILKYNIKLATIQIAEISAVKINNIVTNLEFKKFLINLLFLFIKFEGKFKNKKLIYQIKLNKNNNSLKESDNIHLQSYFDI